jgi:hypothetical protein
MHAVRVNIKYVPFLINFDIDINAQNRKGSTVLGFAMNRSCYEGLADMLLDKGANVNIRNNDGNTVLHSATNHLYKTEFLLQRGANPYIVNIYNDSPIHHISVRLPHCYLLRRIPKVAPLVVLCLWIIDETRAYDEKIKKEISEHPRPLFQYPKWLLD